MFAVIGLCWPMTASASQPTNEIEVTGGRLWFDSIPNGLSGGIAYNGEYVLINPYGDIVWYKSADGVNWESVGAQQERNGVIIDGVSGVKRLIWDGRQFAAISQTQVLTSEDGKLWKVRTIEHPDASKEYILADIVFTGDVYVIVAQERDKGARLYVPGPNTFLVSNDLMTFEIGEKENMGTSIAGERPVIFLATNGKVTIGGGGGSAVTFDNGKHWHGPGTSFGTPYAGFSAIWDGRRFVHAHGETITTSSDGKTWNKHAIKVAGDDAPIDVDNIAYNGAEYIAVPHYPIDNGPLVIYRSYDLYEWEKIEFPSIQTNVIQIEPFQDGFILLGTHTWLYRNHRLSIPSEWAEDGILAAREHGLASDAILNNYRKPITRVEFAEISVRLYDRITGRDAEDGGTEPAPSPFKDTNNAYVARAYQLGIVAGKEAGKFAPFEPITRQDMAVMLVNMLEAAHVPINRTGRQWLKEYTDLDQIDDYAVESLKLLNADGIIQGSEASILPKQTTTREQALVIAWRIYDMFKAY
jgi:hypothetical protein